MRRGIEASRMLVDVTIPIGHNAFERVKHGAGAKAFKGVAPMHASRRLTAS